MRPSRLLKASTSTSMRNWSPGVTGRRNLAFSMPVKTASFFSRSGISFSMMMAPAWAIASTTSTPGMMRIAGKVALKKGLVHGHILDGYQALAALELDDSVNQQKRVAVGK